MIGQNVSIGPDVTIGDRCKIQNNVSVYPGVTLEDGVFCGPSCVFTNVMNPRAEIERKNEFRPTLVKRGATIGANATIVCGSRLGEYCFIAAGAVVTKDVPPFALVAGVPARRIGWVSHSGERLSEDLVCPREGGAIAWPGRNGSRRYLGRKRRRWRDFNGLPEAIARVRHPYRHLPAAVPLRYRSDHRRSVGSRLGAAAGQTPARSDG